jgi:hypothetical protein
LYYICKDIWLFEELFLSLQRNRLVAVHPNRIIETSVQDKRGPAKRLPDFCGVSQFYGITQMQEETAEYTTHCILPSGSTWKIARPETGCEYSGDFIPKSQSASAR